MPYKPAYMVVNNNQIKVFIGNYDNLNDLRAEYKEYFECWQEKDVLLVSLLSPEEYEEKKRRA